MDESSNIDYSFNLRHVTTYQAGVVQAAMHRLLQKECDEYLQEFGITKAQWLIIGTVLDAGEEGMRITKLAEIMQTGLPYLTNTINFLEERGILIRAADNVDSRAKTVTITEQFRPKCAVIERTLRERLRSSIYSRIAPEDFATYMKVLYQLGTPPQDISTGA